MPKAVEKLKTGGQTNILDVLLYVLAGSSIAMISVSFLMWLRF